jgi:elongation factor Ts
MSVTITADQVKKLRDQTGAGMMECKAALIEANGSFEEATTVLRKRGLASAAKKAGRATHQGLIGQWLGDDHSAGVLVEVTCETDFVARTADFQQLVSDVVDLIRAAGDNATDEWLKSPGGPVQQRVAAAIGKTGENMSVQRFVRYAGQGFVGQYIHMGKIGVQVELAGVTPQVAPRDELATLLKEIAMQIAAANPQYATRSAVPADVLEKERAIYRAQTEGQGKPANVIDKIVDGKLGSFFTQFVLPDQIWVRDEKRKMTVLDMLNATNKALGAQVIVNRFARLQVGEGSA